MLWLIADQMNGLFKEFCSLNELPIGAQHKPLKVSHELPPDSTARDFGPRAVDFDRIEFGANQREREFKSRHDCGRRKLGVPKDRIRQSSSSLFFEQAVDPIDLFAHAGWNTQDPFVGELNPQAARVMVSLYVDTCCYEVLLS